MKEGLSIGDEDYPKKICSRINASKPQPSKLKNLWFSSCISYVGFERLSKATKRTLPIIRKINIQIPIITKYKEYGNSMILYFPFRRGTFPFFVKRLKII